VVNHVIRAGVLVTWAELSGHFPVKRLGEMKIYLCTTSKIFFVKKRQITFKAKVYERFLKSEAIHSSLYSEDNCVKKVN
jgi:hypothetical protein